MGPAVRGDRKAPELLAREGCPSQGAGILPDASRHRTLASRGVAAAAALRPEFTMVRKWAA